ncbi:DNA-binding NarL/FixJ family response regulator [Nocardioides ginsengisegetis]|uniref:DNA-binding NarL/FixJ family response regulator n=1 Tax=Nocardioides ginsengisegetis TaxID=661491 RepID=A0A7W3IXS5_9ACTN|nr:MULTISPECIES: response regulator transcription factor [Nocardioides]MBA8802504.1 DNA-binding NarL/FixJ family response regulator [Nocardioides ginsengisegetis]GCD88217.1 DNA-binding response regulator [Nocardioides sp. LS1]
MSVSPARLAVIGTNDITRHGIAALVAEHPGRAVLVPFPTGPGDPEPEVIVYDAIGLLEGDTGELDRLVKETLAAVVVLARDLRPDLAARALARGADGCVSLEADAAHFLAVVEAAAAGQLEGDFIPSGELGGTYARLGDHSTLTGREVEMLGLITLGLSNAEIAERCYLSINSVKTYIRGAYRKIGAADRSQAVQWALRHGFAPRGGTSPN